MITENPIIIIEYVIDLIYKHLISVAKCIFFNK